MGYLFPPVSTSKFINSDGTATPQFILFLNEMMNRVGGNAGGTYAKLSSTGSAILWDLNASPIAAVVLQNGANTLSVLNQVAGFLYPYRLTVIQPASGAAGTITWPVPPMLFPGGVAPTLSTANNAIDEVWFTTDGTNMKLCVESLNLQP